MPLYAWEYQYISANFFLVLVICIDGASPYMAGQSPSLIRSSSSPSHRIARTLAAGRSGAWTEQHANNEVTNPRAISLTLTASPAAGQGSRQRRAGDRLPGEPGTLGPRPSLHLTGWARRAAATASASPAHRRAPHRRLPHRLTGDRLIGSLALSQHRCLAGSQVRIVGSPIPHCNFFGFPKGQDDCGKKNFFLRSWWEYPPPFFWRRRCY